MDTVVTVMAEPETWSVVFHRRPANWFFNLIAMGHFKHVTAVAWVPAARVWIVYDVGFRRTRIIVLPDNDEAKAEIGHHLVGNAVVTLKRRDDALPIMRLGLFCTTAVKHLIGLRSSALRPDGLFHDCLRNGGTVVDHGNSPSTSS